MKQHSHWRAVDLFAGCGGLTLGLKQAGFDVISAVENDSLASKTYARNHPEVKLLDKDISFVEASDLRTRRARKIHLVAGCPPCQGFSRVRRKNRTRSADDKRK
ncbi:MAG: DNA cytosine methyltransferase [Acidobacteria bacterium]|nr:MAG: DNA cytosine methyltransferase [Acidobacteriota bacterium]